MKTFSSLAALVLSLVFAPAIGQVKILIGHTGTPESVPVFAAKEEGYFKRRGLDVELTQISTANLIPSLYSNSVQVITVSPTAMILAVDGGLDLRALGGLSVILPTTTNFGLVVRQGAGIKTASDLVGRKVAVPAIGGFFHVLARQWLTGKGVDYKKVVFVEATFAQMTDLLKGGTVDAVVSGDPFMSRTVQAGVGTMLSYFAQDLPEGTSGGVFATTGEWVKNNPAAAKAFKEALAEGIAFAEKNPAAARADLGKFVKMPPEVLANIAFSPMKAEISAAQLQFWIDMMRRQEMLKTSPDPSRMIFN